MEGSLQQLSVTSLVSCSGQLTSSDADRALIGRDVYCHTARFAVPAGDG